MSVFSYTVCCRPPGTGKTSLLVATICRYLLPQKLSQKGPGRRLIVCAPTNKAVSVLANRFLSAATDSYGCTVNMILVGDDDKLLESKKNSPLRPYYVYSWLTKVLKDFGAIATFFDEKNEALRKYSRRDMLTKALGLKRRVLRSLTSLPADNVVEKPINELCAGLERQTLDRRSLFRLAREAQKAVKELPIEAVLTDLMSSADVIFCTLCSAASRVMDYSRGSTIEALIVDEAAAATEPDLYIPLHLGPSRLLLVGDPKQLPSTVLSDRAKKLGLNISLQERLMNRCTYCYTMLNVQYRMHPEISSFPSRHFYNGMILDGDNVRSRGDVNSTLLDGRPYIFRQVDGTETPSGESRCNPEEASIVLGLVKQLVERTDKSWCCSVDHLRIITFYTAQVAVLKKLLFKADLKDVLVATVDSSQGCEADIVIISLVRTLSSGFLKDDRRMNVALTRARHQLVCVGNVQSYPFMPDAYTLRHLATDAQTRGAIAHVPVAPAAKKQRLTQYKYWTPQDEMV